MGRVSKHKKIKSCDPFYKGPRRDSVRKGNLPPPNDEDQPPPKSLLRLLRFSEQVSSKKDAVSQRHHVVPSQKVLPKSTHKTRQGKIEEEVEKEEENPKTDTQKRAPSTLSTAVTAGKSRQGRAAMFVRRPGESTRDYLERIDIESKCRIADCLKKERKKSDKRKRYLEERRKKLKSRKQPQKMGSFKDFDDFRDDVKFNEVAQAPPQLSAKPRGSGKKAKGLPNLIGDATSSEDVSPSAGQLGLKHQQDIEEERARVIEGYRLAKKLKGAPATKGRTTKSSHAK